MASRPTAVSIAHREEYFFLSFCAIGAPRRFLRPDLILDATLAFVTVMTQSKRPASTKDVTIHTSEPPDRMAFYGMGRSRCFSAIPLRKSQWPGKATVSPRTLPCDRKGKRVGATHAQPQVS